MIFGKTPEQKRASKTKIGDEQEMFALLPMRLPNGQWVWLEWVIQRYTLRNQTEAFDSWKTNRVCKDK